MAEQESAARRCVILAIKSSSVINFEELLDLKSIKALESVSSNPILLTNLVETPRCLPVFVIVHPDRRQKFQAIPQHFR
jgi:hypothetical protein